MYKNKGYYFLASPFQGSSEEKTIRFQLSQKIAATFLESDISIFAPILYNHVIMEYFPKIEGKDRRSLLMPMNMDFLLKSQGMLFLKLEGWESSWGIQQYLEMCDRESMPIYDLHPKDLEEQMQALKPILSQNQKKG